MEEMKFKHLFNLKRLRGGHSVVDSLGDSDLRDRYFVETTDAYIKICLAANQPYKVLEFINDALLNKYVTVSRHHRAQLHTRAAISAITIQFDHECALYHIKRARAYIGKHVHPFDLLLFYCVLGWAHVNRINGEGSDAKGILAFKHAERVAQNDPHSTKIVGRTRKCLSIICRVSDGSIIEEADKIVSLQDIADRVPLHHVYSCINAGFRLLASDQRQGVKWYTTFRPNKNRLFTEMVELYSLVPAPFAGPYERGEPNTITNCVNEFLSIYTNESNKHQATERDVIALEEKYHISFDRNTLKFKWYV